jgi:hypothetical protein
MFRITHPFDKVLILTAVLAVVKDALYLIFRMVINGDGWRWRRRYITVGNACRVSIWS